MSVESILDRLFEKKVIVNCERKPYLHRWYVFRTERISLFIHKFVRSDEDRALHDHPWGFFVLPIWRGYIEHHDPKCEACKNNGGRCLLDGKSHSRRVHPIIGARLRTALYRHRVELIGNKPAWSLFIRFKKIREWGFWMPEGFVQWNKFWQDKCE